MATTYAERPDHVPPSAVYAFDMFHDSELLADPQRRALELTSHAPPIFWTPCNGGFWVVVGYDEARHVLNHPDLFASSPFTEEKMAALSAMLPADAPRMPELIPVLSDPPGHAALRAPLQRIFSPGAAARIRREIEIEADRIIAEIADRGRCEFISEVAFPFVASVFLRMVGLSDDHRDKFRQLIEEYFAPRADALDHARMQLKLVDAVRPVVVEKRDNPGDDLISDLWKETIDGKPITLERMEDYASVLFIAGLGSVADSMSFGIRHLALDRDLQHVLKERPEFIPKAADEILRRNTPNAPQRRVVRDTVLGSVELKAEERMIVLLLAANLDPKVMDSAGTIHLEDAARSHLSFGAGPHRCVGASLARLELQAVYSAAIRKLSPFRLDPERDAAFRGGNNVTITSLPIVWGR